MAATGISRVAEKDIARCRTGFRTAPVWPALAVLVVALNLRPALVAVGPLTTLIQYDTGLSSSAISLLTTLPLICFGGSRRCCGTARPRLGLGRAVLAAMVLLVAGIAIRLLPPLPLLFTGSTVAAGGIALGNVLIPAVVKQRFPDRIGVVMALYSVALQAGAAAAAGVAAPLTLTLRLGWRPGLALWGVPAALGTLAWLPRARRQQTASGTRDEADGTLWRSSLGWAAAVFIGLQSAVYFTLTAWLPTLLQDHGLSESRAGFMLSIVGLAGIAGGLPMPLLATRMRSQVPLVLVAVTCFAAGLAGLLVAPAQLALAWSILLGLAQGGGLSLALTLFMLRSRTAAGAARLSGMAQTAGYLIAAVGPLAAGWTHSLTGGWTTPIVVLLAVLVPFAAAGVLLARPRTREDGLTPRTTTAKEDTA